MDFAILDFGFGDDGVERQRHLADDLVANEPARSRTENGANLFEAKFLGHVAEDQRKVAAQPELPAGANAGDGFTQTVEEGGRRGRRWIVKTNLGFAHDDLNTRANFVEQSGDIESGGAATDNDHVASAKFVEISVIGAVGDVLLGQIGNGRRNKIEVGEAG